MIFFICDKSMLTALLKVNNPYNYPFWVIVVKLYVKGSTLH